MSDPKATETGAATRTNSADRAKQLIEARYREPEFAERISQVGWNGVLDGLFSHRSVRNYLDKPLEPGMLELIIGAAQSAATTSNLHAWSVVAVRDKDRKARLADCAAGQRHIYAAPLLLVFVADLARLRAISEKEGMAGEGLDYLEAFVFAIADAAFAAQNAVVALESLGLGCCYIGAMRNDLPTVAKELALPDDTMVVFGMTIGYPDPAVKTDIKPRLPQSMILHEEQYKAPDMDAIDTYNLKMRDFQAEQNMRSRDWSRLTAERVKDEAALTGRHIMKDFLRERGFKLR